MSAKPTIDTESVRTQLLARREELLERHDASEEARQTVEVDQSRVGRLSRMEALQAQAMAIETDRMRNVELQRIAATLKRIEAGEYGQCLKCGEDISPRRLELDPTAPLCMDCTRPSNSRG